MEYPADLRYTTEHEWAAWAGARLVGPGLWERLTARDDAPRAARPGDR